MILSEKLFETLDDDTFDKLQDRLEKAYYFPGVDGDNLAVKLIMKKKHIDELKGKQPARLIANSISRYRPIKDESELEAAKKIADEFGLKSEVKEFNGRLYLTIKLDESLNEDANNFDLMSEIINDPDTEKYKNRHGSYSYRTVGPLRWYLLKCNKAGIDPVQTDEFKWEAKGPNYEFEYIEGDAILTPTKLLSKKDLSEDLNSFNYDKLQKELEAIPNVTKVEFDKNLIYDTHELVVLISWNSDSDTAQWFRDKAQVKNNCIKVFKDNNLKLSDPVEDNNSYFYFVLRESAKLDEDIVKSIEPLDSEVAKEIDFVFASDDQGFGYKMLDRLRSDCAYILGALKDNSSDGKISLESINKFLWFHDIDKQIAFMKGIYDRLDEKPEWLSKEEINDYEDKLKDLIRVEESLKEDLPQDFENLPREERIELLKTENERKALLKAINNIGQLANKNPTIKQDWKVIKDLLRQNNILKEDLSQEEQQEYGLNTLINELIKSEYDAIDEYNSAIVTLEAENQGEYTDVIRSIIEDERHHIGNLQEIMNRITPGTEAEFEHGKEEAIETLDEEKPEETRTTIDTENGEIKTYKLDKVEKVEESVNNLHKKPVTYWEDVKDSYCAADDIYDTMYSKEQINAWRKQWKPAK